MAAPTSQGDARAQYAQKSPTQKLWEKTKKEPFVPLGFLGMLGMVGYGAYAYRRRGNMSTSVYLMHLRVKAQSVVVGAMTLGVSWGLYNTLKERKDK